MNVQSVIGDVTQTLENLLQENQQPLDWFRISLDCPAEVKVSQSNKPLVNLYLLHVRPNPTGFGPPMPMGRERMCPPPLALHLCYILTPFAQNPLDAHRVLGTAMAIFHEQSQLDPTRLHGSLVFGEHGLNIDLCTYSLEDQTNIWSALGSAYRTSVFYRVRVVTLVTGKTEPVKRAEIIDHRIQPL